MKYYIRALRAPFIIISAAIAAIFAAAALAQAATTIGTDISTAGQLSVTGATTLLGNVGIGTPATTASLELNGHLLIDAPSNSDGIYFNDYATSSNPQYSWQFDNRGGVVRGDIGMELVIYNPVTAKYTWPVIFSSDNADDSENITFNRYPVSGADTTVTINSRSDGGSGGVQISNEGDGPALGVQSNVWVSSGGKLSVGTSTPAASFQATNASSNATTTVEFGKSGQNKGTCLKLYRTDGSAIYAYVAAGDTTFTLSTTACASVANF